MLDIDRRRDAAERSRALGATWLSVGLHVSGALLIAVVAGRKPAPETTVSSERKDPPLLVWLEQPGPIGGGRYGDSTPEPTRRAERPGRARLTVPSRLSPSLADKQKQDPSPQQISIPVVPEASGLREVPGHLTTVSIVAVPMGGPGSSAGAGDGEGSGLDRGRNGGIGEGTGGPGGNATSPELIKQVRPNYTSPALQARVQGTVVMDAIVLPDGSVGEVKVVRSLDRTFGLDEEAIRAVKQWRFRPGKRAGDPIAMLVSVEMLFELR